MFPKTNYPFTMSRQPRGAHGFHFVCLAYLRKSQNSDWICSCLSFKLNDIS